MNQANSPIERMLDLARWAPSGDNTQPWRFEVAGRDRVVVHGFDTRDDCVYDLDGHASHMAHGALLESMCIAATGCGLKVTEPRRSNSSEREPTFEIRIEPDPAVEPSPLLPYITTRSVQRRALSTRPLTPEQKAELAASIAPDYQVEWFEDWEARWRVAKLMFHNAKLRLTLPEAYQVHRRVIEWHAQHSEDRIPDGALGLDPLTLKLMAWVMQSWQRVRFFNKWLAGTWLPRLQLDLVPGLACAAHFGITAASAPQSIDDYVAAGRAMQRFWLEATRLGLLLQPEMTPVIFGRYEREGRTFTVDRVARALGAQVASALVDLKGEAWASRLVFLARIGSGAAPSARSTRLPLARLWWVRSEETGQPQSIGASTP
jgi:hypothetical protein